MLVSELGEHNFSLSNDQFADINITSINTDTLESKILFTQKFDYESSWSDFDIHQSSEELFYVKKDNSFYNINGEKAFEIPVDNVEEVGKFIDGKCEIITRIESGTQFKVIIDKSGNIIENEKLS